MRHHCAVAWPLGPETTAVRMGSDDGVSTGAQLSGIIEDSGGAHGEHLSDELLEFLGFVACQ